MSDLFDLPFGDAAFDHLQAWVEDGTAPPSAPPIEVTSVGPPAVIARDKNGNSSSGGSIGPSIAESSC